MVRAVTARRNPFPPVEPPENSPMIQLPHARHASCGLSRRIDIRGYRVAIVGAAAIAGPAAAQPVPGSDVYVRYFDRTTVDLSAAIAGYDYDPSRDAFYVTGFLGQPQATWLVTPAPGSGRTDVLTFADGTWSSQAGSGGSGFTSQNLVGDTPWNLFARSKNLDANGGQGDGDPNLSGQPVPGNLRLNPTALTLEGITYQPGEVSIFTDGMRITDPSLPRGENVLNDRSKLVYAYDLRPVDRPDSTPGNNVGRDRDGDGRVDYNDVFSVIATRADFQDQLDSTEGTFNQARDFAFAGDGKSIYVNDAASNFGGIYRVGLENGQIQRLVTATDAARINTEPAVLSTAALDLDPTDGLTGDQIFFESSSATGVTDDNDSGIDYLTVDGNTASPVKTLVSGSQLRAMLGVTSTEVRSITADAATAELYFYESDSDALFRLDPTTGLVAKLASELQHSTFQNAFGPGTNVNFLDLSTRDVSVTVDGSTFDLTEVLFSDSGFDAPVGVLAFRVGDLNRDNAVDFDDDALFQAQQAKSFDEAQAEGGAALHLYLAADLTGDDVVNQLDRDLFLAWNPGLVPEPAAGVLLAFGAVLSCGRRRVSRGDRRERGKGRSEPTARSICFKPGSPL